jgi:Outer membrane protein beta-barrel domain
MKYPLLFLLTISTLIINAQEKNYTSFGIKGGLNKSIVNGHELNGAKTGYIGIEVYGAFFADTKLNAKWRFENEILFSFTDDYHFVEVPLHVKYYILKKTAVLLGPKLDMIVDNDDAVYDFNNFGVSLEVGAQYDITKRIVSEIRFSKGLMKQINDYGLDIYDGKRNTIRLGVGFRFNE